MLVTGMASAQENASNPLASVNNVDFRWKYTSADSGDRHDVFVDGSHMVLPELKLKYELHYNFTDVTGSNPKPSHQQAKPAINLTPLSRQRVRSILNI